MGEEAVLLGDFSPVNKHALRAVARFMAEREVAFAWKKGVACLNSVSPESRAPCSGCSFSCCSKPRTFSSLTTAVHFGSFKLSPNLVVAWLCEVLHSRQSFEPPRRVLAALRGKPLRGPALRAGAAGAELCRLPGDSHSPQLPSSGIIGTGAMGKEHIRNVVPSLLQRPRQRQSNLSIEAMSVQSCEALQS